MGFYEERNTHIRVPIDETDRPGNETPPAPMPAPAPLDDRGAGFYVGTRAYICVSGHGEPEYDALVDLQARAAAYARTASASASGAEAVAASIEGTVSDALEEAKSSGQFNGADGQSAYEAAIAGGYTGTESDFYADLGAMDNLATALSSI